METEYNTSEMHNVSQNIFFLCSAVSGFSFVLFEPTLDK